MSLPTATVEAVLAGMLTALASIKAPVGGASATQYLRVLDRYTAGSIKGVDAESVDAPRMLLVNGVTGRTPAVLVDYVGDKIIHTTVGGKTARMESTYIAICVADPARPDRERPVAGPIPVPGIFQVTEAVRLLLASRAFGLGMQGLRFANIVVIAETPNAYAWGVKFTSRKVVDYTKQAVRELMLTVNNLGLADGAIKDRYGIKQVPVKVVFP